MRTHSLLLAVALLSGSFLAARPLAAQSPTGPKAEPASRFAHLDEELAPTFADASGAFRLVIGPTFGVAGAITAKDDYAEESLDLDPSFGFFLQPQIPVHRYLSIGVHAGYRSLALEEFRNRPDFFNVDALVVARYPIPLGAVAIEPYVSLALGLGVASPDIEDEQEDVQLGFDLGLRGGATLWFSEVVGVQAGLGYQRTQFKIEGIKLFTGQLHLDFGLALRFGV